MSQCESSFPPSARPPSVTTIDPGSRAQSTPAGPRPLERLHARGNRAPARRLDYRHLPRRRRDESAVRVATTCLTRTVAPDFMGRDGAASP